MLLPLPGLGASFLIHCLASPHRPFQELSCSFIPSGRGQDGDAPPMGTLGRLLHSSGLQPRRISHAGRQEA